MNWKVITVYILVATAVVGLGVWLYHTSSQVNPSDKPGQTFENQGQTHIDQGSTDHPAYNSNPPTSGWHWPAPADWGTYNSTQPDEQLVHNLEHGGIWISYKPGSVDQQTIADLDGFATRYHLIIVEPRDKDDHTIALAAWTHLEYLDKYDETAVLRFIQAYYNQGPEKVE